jgi:hypothetical protein
MTNLPAGWRERLAPGAWVLRKGLFEAQVQDADGGRWGIPDAQEVAYAEGLTGTSFAASKAPVRPPGRPFYAGVLKVKETARTGHYERLWSEFFATRDEAIDAASRELGYLSRTKHEVPPEAWGFSRRRSRSDRLAGRR